MIRIESNSHYSPNKFENVLYGKKISDHAEKLTQTLERVGLSEKRKSFPSELSGGQQQRVAIARALITEPKIFLANEPTGNLDDKSSREVMALFAKVNQELGVTILQVTHSTSMASFGSKTYVLEDGKLLEK